MLQFCIYSATYDYLSRLHFGSIVNMYARKHSFGEQVSVEFIY